MSKSELLTPFELRDNYSANYTELIEYYEMLAEGHPWVQVESIGQTDVGRPLHVVVIDKDGTFDPASSRQQGKLIYMINNGIHPGEPCGIDASMIFARDILEHPDQLEQIVIVIIPVYNVGGMLNRSATSRANQNGPKEYGFRGNARNLDLNRDFIKCDSKNAQWFNLIYNMWDPDVFVDTHTSNGADYQYTMTLIATQRNKLAKPLADYMYDSFLPELYQAMDEKHWEMTPYVNARSTPDQGIAAFLDLPRYSSGYAALHHAMSFMPETHMLKPFEDRVMSTLTLLNTVAELAVDHRAQIIDARKKARQWYNKSEEAEISWKLNTEYWEEIAFKGYTAVYEKSEVSGLDRLRYNREKPYEKRIRYYNRYEGLNKVDKPAAYVIPQVYESVIQRLVWNGVTPQMLKQDTVLQVEAYYIESYESTDRPYEGHYLHSDVKVRKEFQEVTLRRGDFIIPTDQESQRYIIETLEPMAPDSYFAWNFFDGILMQKEYFSSYVFEDEAVRLLQEDPSLAEAFEEAKKSDPSLQGNARAQLDWIYRHSPYYEETHMRYPVFRIPKK